MTTLVATASRHGATAGIAEAIGAVLRERGLDVEVVPVEDVRSLERYDAVVLGSAVYVGRWVEQARRFAREHATELAERPTWLFSSGPVGDPPKPAEDEAVQLDEIVAATNPVDHRLFAGIVDSAHLGLCERVVLAAVRAKQGDYRDWPAVRRYAEAIADELAPRCERPRPVPGPVTRV